MSTAIIFLILGTALTYMLSAMGLVVAYTATMVFFFGISVYYLKKLVNFDDNILNIVKIVIASSVWIGAFIIISRFISTSLFQWIVLALTSIIYVLGLLFLRFYTREDLRVLEFISSHVPQTKSLAKKISEVVAMFV